MKRQSLFSQYYRNIVQNNANQHNQHHHLQSQLQTHQEETEPNLHFQANQNYFQTALADYTVKGKKQPKIKVFGARKSQQKHEEAVGGQIEHKQPDIQVNDKSKQDQNLLDSQSIKVNSPIKQLNEANDAMEQNQLHKLLDFSDDVKSEYNNSLPYNEADGKQQQLEENELNQMIKVMATQNRGQMMIKMQKTQSEFYDQKISRTEKKSESEKLNSQILNDNVDLEQLISKKSVSHAENLQKQIHPATQSGINSSNQNLLISGISASEVESLLEFIGKNNSPSKNYKQKLEVSVIQEEDEDQKQSIKGKGQNVLSEGLGSKQVKEQVAQVELPLSNLNKSKKEEMSEYKSHLKKILQEDRHRLIKMKSEQQFKKIDLKQRPFVPLPKKKEVKAQTLFSDKLYEKEVEDLIQRCEKLAELKDQNKQIKRTIDKLQNYKLKYEKSQISQTHYDLISSKINREKIHIFDQSHVSERHQTMQSELTQYIGNVELIIKNLKEISQTIDKQDSVSEIDSKNNLKKKKSSKHSFLVEEAESSSQAKKKYSASNEKAKDQHNLTQKIRKLEDSQYYFESVNFNNSIGEDIQKMKAGRVEMINKNTARTEKKQSIISINSKQNLHSQTLKELSSSTTHQILLNEIAKLHQKIDKLELRTQSKEDPSRNRFSQSKQQSSIERQSKDARNTNKIIFDSQIQKDNPHLPVTKTNKSKTNRLSVPTQRRTPKQHIYGSADKAKRQSKISLKIVESKCEMKDVNEKVEDLEFPEIKNFPSRQHSDQQLLKIGVKIYKKISKYLAEQRNWKEVYSGRLSMERNFDLVHYYPKDAKGFHLIYYFKGKVYFGQWVCPAPGKGCRHGIGFYHNIYKYIYEGEFYQDKIHGSGLIKYLTGEKYYGFWVDGKKEGRGTYVNKKQDVYIGQFVRGKKHGKGQQHLSNGDYYKGQFRNGKINGRGQYRWSDGSFYIGEFQDGHLHGRGKWRSKDNNCYEGQYRNNEEHGYGTYKWSNGDIFTGYFENGRRVINEDYGNRFERQKRQNEKLRSSREQGREKIIMKEKKRGSSKELLN